jgi:hypothetical protein
MYFWTSEQEQFRFLSFSKEAFPNNIFSMLLSKPLYFSTGIIIANILHDRLRQKCSSLKCDLFRCNLIASCNCDCGNYIESVDHFFLKCNIKLFRCKTKTKNIQRTIAYCFLIQEGDLVVRKADIICFVKLDFFYLYCAIKQFNIKKKMLPFY